jgi:organic hydroperoxide reductase OsmC/OhrA
MTEHQVVVAWERESEGFSYEEYNRDHLWSFIGGARVPASAAPDYRGNPAHLNPEDAFVAALSSCHMLTFLAVAARKGFVVDVYRDEAIGSLEKNSEGKMAMTRVILHPRITFGGSKSPTPEELKMLHDLAHRGCYIANSVKTEVTVATR